MTTSADVTLFFVVQPGSLALKARLLAASLRKFGPADLKIRACLPIGHDDIDAGTQKTLDMLEVECVRFEPLLWNEFNYPIGNKLDAACTTFETSRAVFLDSDILALRPFDPSGLCIDRLTARTIMGTQNYTADIKDVMSDFISRTLGAEYLDLTAEQAAVKTPAEIGIPVYNSGVVSFATGQDVPNRWRELAYAVLRDKQLPESVKFPFADQTSLALLALELRERFSVLDRKWNTQIPGLSRDPFWVHYFKLFALFDTDIGLKTVTMLAEENARRGLNLLGEISLKDLSYLRQKSKAAAAGKRGNQPK